LLLIVNTRHLERAPTVFIDHLQRLSASPQLGPHADQRSAGD
jgi:hypothetical protein